MLLTCAGIAHPGYFERLDDDIFRRTMEVDYFGTLHAMRAVVPSMMERRSGSAVGISSAAGLVGIFGYTPYAPAKFAVRGLLEALRCEAAPYGVHVGCVCPADTETPQLAYENRFKPAETRAISGQIKPMSADHVAAAIVRGIEARLPDHGRLADPAAGPHRRLVRGTFQASFDRRVRKARGIRSGRPCTSSGPPSPRDHTLITSSARIGHEVAQKAVEPVLDVERGVHQTEEDQGARGHQRERDTPVPVGEEADPGHRRARPP